jgi:very-short-patch-repair endonuclease
MRTNRKSQEDFIAQAVAKHGNKFDYSKVRYVNNRTAIEILCNQCQTTFYPNPYNFLNCKNCPTCAITTQRKSSAEFIDLAKSIHGDNYDYSEVNYINAKTKVKIKCNMCEQSFLQLPRGHLYEESGCPRCRQSHGEEKISLLLRLLNIQFHCEHKFKECVGKYGVPLRFDFYLPKQNMCIEYDGRQHVDKTSKYWSPSVQENDFIKTEFCKQKGIKLRRIPHTEIEKVEDTLRTELFT